MNSQESEKIGECPRCGKMARRVISPVCGKVIGGHDSEYDAYGPRKRRL